ncbi:amidase [Bradyrhizobium sp. 23AC]
MHRPELLTFSAEKLAQGFRSRTFSPVEVLGAIERYTAQVNPQVNAFLSLNFEEAHEQARASEKRWTEQRAIGPLDGVPVSVKDHISVAGWVSRNGTVITDGKARASFDAPAAARLREAGAVLFAKTTMPEYGWKGAGNSRLTGVTRNPWNLRKTPGGSSSGAAAAVASGLGPLAAGSDGGGSIRIPCSYSGLFGLKPSGGRVPHWPSSVHQTMTHVGPMARNVTDAALMLQVLAQPDARDWYALPPGDVDYFGALKSAPDNVRIGYTRDMGFVKVDSEVLKVVDHVVDHLRREGLAIEDCAFDLGDPTPTFDVLFQSQMAAAVRDFTDAQLALLDPGLQGLIAKGRKVEAAEYVAAVMERVKFGSRAKQFSQACPILLSPVCCTTAFDADLSVPPGFSEDDHMRSFLTHPFNLSVQPAASVPIGVASDGLPVGLQIVGPMFRDDLVLQVAKRVEDVLALDDWPAIWAPSSVQFRCYALTRWVGE